MFRSRLFYDLYRFFCLQLVNVGFMKDFDCVMNDLDYKNKVTVSIAAFNRGSGLTSGNTSLSFITPTCQEMFGHNYLARCGKTVVFFVFQSLVGCSR